MSDPLGPAAKRRHGIYLRLIVPLGITLLVAMLGAWVIAAQLLTDSFNRRLDEQLANATDILAQGEFPFSRDLLVRLDQLLEARIVLLDADGNPGLTTASTSPAAFLSPLAARMDEMRGESFRLLTAESGGDSWRIAIRPIPRGRDSRYHYVVAAASLEQTRDAAWNAAALLGAAMLSATVLLAWFAHYFSRGITGPVSELATMANRIADGEREIESDISASNEIGVLARALNDMARRLTDYEHELAQRSRLAGLGDLAARMAHEIRNPLTAIKMQLQLLEESVPGSDSARVARLLDEIRRMELIVDSALTLGAPPRLDPRPVDVGPMVQELAELLRPALAHRGIDLETRTEFSPEIVLDADRMRQVLLNLINNAAEALQNDGRIRVSTGTAVDGAGVEISVEDSGPGMSPDAGAGDRKPYGLGIGLTICREIVALHGGELVEGSSADLGGARLTIRLANAS